MGAREQRLIIYDLNRDSETVWAGGRLGMACPVWLPFTKLMLALDPEQRMELPGVEMDRFREESHMTEQGIGEVILPNVVMAVGMVPKEAGLSTELLLASPSYALPLLQLADTSRSSERYVEWAVEPNWIRYRFDYTKKAARAFGANPLEKAGEARKFSYESNDGGDREIYVLGSRGINNVSNHRSSDWNPVWSPDGKSIAFESMRSGQRGVFRVYADTARVVAVSPAGPWQSWGPSWSPEGDGLLYASNKTGDVEIFYCGIGGGNPTQLTDRVGVDEAPTWRPGAAP